MSRRTSPFRRTSWRESPGPALPVRNGWKPPALRTARAAKCASIPGTKRRMDFEQVRQRLLPRSAEHLGATLRLRNDFGFVKYLNAAVSIQPGTVDHEGPDGAPVGV